MEILSAIIKAFLTMFFGVTALILTVMQNEFLCF